MQTSQWIPLIQWISTLVLIVLAGLSVWSVAIMIESRRRFKSLTEIFKTEPAEKIKLMILNAPDSEIRDWAAENTNQDPRKSTLKAALDLTTSNSEAIDRVTRTHLVEQRQELEKGLTVLATLGSNAPFIGLFGTVLGIIRAFGELASQTQGSQTVIAGVSEALIATAVGLLVAIPAVVAYNYFQLQVRNALSTCEAVRDLWVARQSNANTRSK